MQKIEHRIHKLEVAMAKLPPSPEPGTGPIDFKDLMQRMENMFQLAEHADPLIRLQHFREKIDQAEQKLAAEKKCKSDMGPELTKMGLPIDHYRARDAELEILEKAGFDTGELRAIHQKHAANPYKWPFRDSPLPGEAPAILDRILLAQT